MRGNWYWFGTPFLHVLRKGGAMGQPNNALNVYMRRADRIRSVLEYYMGEKLPEEWAVEPDDSFFTIRNSKGKLSFRQRDCMRRIQVCGYGFYLGLENQETVNLTFPCRLMELDSLAYGRGIEEVQERNRAMAVKYGAEDDFKYAYRKGDRLLPIMNLTLYWGRKKWEYPLSMRDMVKMEALPVKLKGLFEDYGVHLIHMRYIPEEDLQMMDSELKYVLGLMSRTGSRKRYESYIWENREYFSRMPKSAVDVIDACTGIRDITGCLKYTSNRETGEEEADVCKALKEIKRNAERKGMKRGVKQGVKQGETRLGELMQKLLKDGRTEEARLAAADETERNRLYEECGIVSN